MRKLVLAILVLALMEMPLFAASTTKTTEPSVGSSAIKKTKKTRKVRRARARRSARRGRLRRVRIPWSPIRGTRESLLRQNERTLFIDELERIQDDEQLYELTQSGDLIELPDEDFITVAGNLPSERRYCRPWTRSFLEDLGRDFYDRFGRPLTVTSAVRTVAVQKKLRRRNRNAADIDGDLASPHLTGATIDIGKRGLSRKQLAWLREYLKQARDTGVIDVAEEFRQKVFHITVYRDYEVAREQDAAAQPQPGLVPAVLQSEPQPGQDDAPRLD